MERIKLSKEEKQALRIVAEFGGECPITYPKHVFVSSIRSLARKGLVKANYLIGGDVYHAKLTGEGKHYLCSNHKLINPIDWTIIGVIVAILALIVSIVALFLSCSRL